MLSYLLQNVDPIRPNCLPLVHGLRDHLDDVLQLDALVGDEPQKRALPGADVALDAERDAAVGRGGAEAAVGAVVEAGLLALLGQGLGGLLLLAAGLVVDEGDVVGDLVGVAAVADADLVLERKGERERRKRGRWKKRG